MTIVNNPYITIIVGVCSIISRDIPLYGGEESGGCGGEGVCGYNGGAVVAVEKGMWLRWWYGDVVEGVCSASMVASGEDGEGACGCDGGAAVVVMRVRAAAMVAW